MFPVVLLPVLRLKVLEFNIIQNVRPHLFLSICLFCMSKLHTVPVISDIYFHYLESLTIGITIGTKSLNMSTLVLRCSHVTNAWVISKGIPNFCLSVTLARISLFVSFHSIQNYINICKTTSTTWPICVNN